jgi:hypothetical protein
VERAGANEFFLWVLVLKRGHCAGEVELLRVEAVRGRREQELDAEMGAGTYSRERYECRKGVRWGWYKIRMALQAVTASACWRPSAAPISLSGARCPACRLRRCRTEPSEA